MSGSLRARLERLEAVEAVRCGGVRTALVLPVKDGELDPSGVPWPEGTVQYLISDGTGISDWTYVRPGEEHDHPDLGGDEAPS